MRSGSSEGGTSSTVVPETNLCNERPSWLVLAHERLDRSVYVAYGWSYPLDPDDVLARLVELNLNRAGEPESGDPSS